MNPTIKLIAAIPNGESQTTFNKSWLFVVDTKNNMYVHTNGKWGKVEDIPKELQ